MQLTICRGGASAPRAAITIGVLLLASSLAGTASAAVQTRVVDYTQDGTPLQGMLAWNDTATGKRPGVLVIHEWWGHNEHARNQARRLAEAGYVAFALDMFGKGKVTTHPDDAMKFMSEAVKDPATMKARFDAAMAVLKADPHVDASQVAAVGYCFGGGVALNMAAQGEPLAAVVSLHGALSALGNVAPGSIKGKVLVLSGADDPMVPPAAVDAFKTKMTAAGVDYKVISYPGAKHAFTNPDADKAGVPGLSYNAEADKKSFAAMLEFLKTVFH
jgi:dienelactone hydrolase